MSKRLCWLQQEAKKRERLLCPQFPTVRFRVRASSRESVRALRYSASPSGVRSVSAPYPPYPPCPPEAPPPPSSDEEVVEDGKGSFGQRRWPSHFLSGKRERREACCAAEERGTERRGGIRL